MGDKGSTFDPNVWYQLSEARVDTGNQPLNSNLVVVGPPENQIRMNGNDKNYWQFIPTKDNVSNRFHMRSQKAGNQLQLAVCYNKDEVHRAKTGVCLASAKDVDEQKWEVFEWNDGTTAKRFINVKNGTKYWLDVHKGNPIFMNDDIDTSKYQPAQKWFVSSISAIDDPNFSYTAASATAPPGQGSQSSDPAAPTGEVPEGQNGDSEGSSPHLSAAASAGIGIGVALGVLMLVAALFFILRKKKKAKLDAERTISISKPIYNSPYPYYSPHPYSTPSLSRHTPSPYPSEVGSSEAIVHEKGSDWQQSTSPQELYGGEVFRPTSIIATPTAVQGLKQMHFPKLKPIEEGKNSNYI